MIPNLIYIGTDKAGSTWLFSYFKIRREIYVPPAKDIGFFDEHYERGLDWYERHFRGIDSEVRWISELSHNYLYSRLAATRMSDVLPTDSKLIVTLREPVSRAFSAFLYLRKHGEIDCDFPEALKKRRELLDRGRYHRYLIPYLKYFSRDQIIVLLFEDLKEDEEAFAAALAGELGLSSSVESLPGKVLPAGRGRSTRVARVVKEGARIARRFGMVNLVGRIKQSSLVHRSLYVPYESDERPEMDRELKTRLREEMRKEVEATGGLLGMDLLKRWGYER